MTIQPRVAITPSCIEEGANETQTARLKILRLDVDRIRFGWHSCDSIQLRFDSDAIQLRQGNLGFDSVAIRFGWDSIRFTQLEVRIPIMI